MLALAPLSEIDPFAIERLLDRAFGADRQQRTAYRLREGAHPLPELSFAALADGELIGSIQCWPVAHHGDNGVMTPLVMVGPVAVDPAWQRSGLGRRLMETALAVAGERPLLLIGDLEYYQRFFGFAPERTAQWRLPGPFEPRRLLARGVGVPDAPGTIGPRGAGIAVPGRLTPQHADGRTA